MNLTLTRLETIKEATIGELRIDGAWFCWTLEDLVRESKIKDQTAIPAGRYDVIVNESTRFGVEMPLLLNVDGFRGIRIHYGNSAADTSGCILLGLRRHADKVLSSRDAYARFMSKLKVAGNKAVITITQPVGWPVWGGKLNESTVGAN